MKSCYFNEKCDEYGDCVGFSVYKKTRTPSKKTLQIPMYKLDHIKDSKKQNLWIVLPLNVGQCYLHWRVETQECRHTGQLQSILYVKGNNF